MFGALAVGESYRREVIRLQQQLEERSAASEAAGPDVATEQEPTAETRRPVGVGVVPDWDDPDRPRLSQVVSSLSKDQLIDLSDDLVSRGHRPAHVDLELVRRLDRSDDPKEREELARQLLQSPNDQLRLRGIQELLSAAPVEGLERLQSFVADLVPEPFSGDQPLAEAAIQSLAGVSGPDAERQLYAYFESRREGIFVPAARALEVRGDSEPMQQLIEQFTRPLEDPDVDRRRRIITDLRRTRSPSAVPALVRLLEDPEPVIRRRALSALAVTGDRSLIPQLEKFLQDPDPGMRDRAQTTIFELSQSGGAQEPGAP